MKLNRKQTSRHRRRIRLPAVGLVGIGLVGLTVLVAVLAPLLAPHDPLTQNLNGRLLPPGSPGHLLGTDELGRDLLSRLLYGARTPILVGATAVIIGAGLGGLLGMISGYFGGWQDRIIMRLADIQLSLPAILLALTVIAVRGPELSYLIGVLALGVWPPTARVVRSQTLEVRQREFVLAAHSVGASSAFIIRHHVVRHVFGPLIVIATLELGQTILLAAALSFLGLGVQPPTPDWGSTLAQGREYLYSAWWIATIPGIALILLVVGVNLIGDWLRDRLDPNIEQISMKPGTTPQPAIETPPDTTTGADAEPAALSAPVRSTVDHS